MLAALGEPRDEALDAALGSQRASELRAAVAAHAVRVAQTVAGAVLASTRVPGAAAAGTERFDEPHSGTALVAALGERLAGHEGPVVLLAPDVPGIDVPLVRHALGDLRDGCAIAISSGHEARACLLAIRRVDRRLLSLVAAGASRSALVDLIETAASAEGEVGFLRHERRLVSPADAAALAADPLADPALRALARRG